MMNVPTRGIRKLAVATVALLLMAACAPAMVKPDGAAAVRAKLTLLQSDPQLATRAPVAIKDAEVAVRAAEQPQRDGDAGRHLVFLADRKVDIARAQAQSRLFEDQRKNLGEQRESARLDSRTREANAARKDADVATARARAATAEAGISQAQAEAARGDADAARTEADSARMDTQAAMRQAQELRLQVIELNARETDRGMVVTLGDVLFATGRSELKGGVPSNLGKLAVFLNKHPDRTVIIEGHTDSVGSEISNRNLSQRRADSVKAYLVSQSVGSNRLASSGLGEAFPIGDNNTETGRQQNRRVEVIISNAVTALK